MPMFHVWLGFDDITFSYHPLRLAFFLIITFPLQYQQHLRCIGVSVPIIVAARLKGQLVYIVFRVL